MPRSYLFHSIIEEEKKKFLKKLSFGYYIGNIIDLTASSKTKPHTAWN